MPFGLTNAPATFQHFINDCVRDYLDMFCTAYLDDILIYSDTFEEHQVHVEKVLEALERNGVLLKPEKCEFHTQSTTYLGLIIGPNGIKMDPRKVETVKHWTVPKTVQDDISFEWTPEAQTAFNALKKAFTTAPILTHFDLEKEITVETDASDYVSAGVLSQYDDNGTLRPVAYFSKKHSPAECNYEIYEKELLAIIRSFEEWRPELEGAAYPIAVISDHKNLQYFMRTKQLNRRQARWAEYLSRFNFVIKYRPGKQGGKPDALTRRSADLPGEGDERQLHQSQIVLKKENLDAKLSLLAGSFSNEPAEKNASLNRLLDEGYSADPFPQKILDMRNKAYMYPTTTLSSSESSNFTMTLPLPDTLDAKKHSNSSVETTTGREKTFELISRDYYWPLMRNYIARYVRNCHTCQRSKPNTHGKLGVLRPLPIPEQPWQEVSMDFVTGLLVSEGYDAIIVVVDRLTKMRHLLSCNTTVNSEDIAQLYLRYIWKLYGLPTHVTSDRGTQFTAKFWRALCKHLDIEARMSTAFHPETDGQTERLNAIMEQYLEFSANNQVSASTKATPFFANYGFHPRFTVTIKSLDRTPPSLNAKDFTSKMKELHEHLRSNIRTVQDQQEQAANTKRTPAPRYDIGDMVFVSAKNIRTTRNSRKLDWKKLGPFPVKEIISPYAYRIDLPRSMKVHPVFHVSLLNPAANDPVPGQTQPPPPPIIVEQEEEYAVEEILDSRETRNNGLQYFVKWTGYTDPTWEPAAYHDNTAAVDTFHTRYPDKPGPLEGKIKVKARRSSRLKRGATFMDRLVNILGYEELD
ncbi:uncharacterized protein H6S33_001008 [Morchella sextelata]|uniref:uncharacterized protein n=1 Tax=Morchella sextelata TaxID=1174677 RepID=UPI001D04265A|nr:uncharacterized protein H6S33_001008 [Morchella sextelata]KAH0608780.1 hypothetical protein H6S33_001008 [Morchella sextelata]